MFIEYALCFKCYSRPTPTFAARLCSTRYEWKNRKSDNSQFPIILMVVKTFLASCFFRMTIWWANKEQSNFSGTELNLKGLPLTSKVTSGYFGQIVWNWIKGNIPGFEKFRWHEQWRLHVNYLRAQVNYRQLPAETAGNRYLRRFLPAPAIKFTCGTGYLQPLQIILHVPFLQCILYF